MRFVRRGSIRGSDGHHLSPANGCHALGRWRNVRNGAAGGLQEGRPRPGRYAGVAEIRRSTDFRRLPKHSRPFPKTVLLRGDTCADAMTIELADDCLRGVELGPAMQQCSVRERRFAYLLGTGICETASDAARQAGYVDPGRHSSTIRVTGHHLLHRERVTKAIEEVARKEFRTLLLPTIAAMRRLIKSPDHPDHARSVATMLSRLGFGERNVTEINVSGDVTVNHTDAALEDLRRLKSLGVPREKLIEDFGFSGLKRYEQMLAERDARAPKVIEHKPDELAAGGVEQHHNPMDTS
jgi:hypothetical protein